MAPEMETEGGKSIEDMGQAPVTNRRQNMARYPYQYAGRRATSQRLNTGNWLVRGRVVFPTLNGKTDFDNPVVEPHQPYVIGANARKRAERARRRVA